MFMTAKQAAEKWGLSERRVRVLCAEGKIPRAFQEGRRWKIPVDATKPADGRFKSAESLLEIIDRKKAELDTRRPLTEGGRALPVSDYSDHYVVTTAAPILAEGDVLGCVVFMADAGQVSVGEDEYKLAQTIAGFLGRHMES